MKCKYCGSNLTIDDEKCPFCGKDNPFAVKHREEMKFFSKKFQKTQNDVIEKTNRFNGWTVRITVIAVLVALNVILLFMLANKWEIRAFFENRKIEEHLNVHISKMKELEEKRDYIGFSQYYNSNRLSLNKHFDEYEVLHTVCNNYEFLYQYLPGISKERYDDYYTKEEQAESIASQVYYIYQYSKQDKYMNEKCFTKKHMDTMNDLKNHLNYILKTYCKVTDEELDKLPTLSKARIQLIIERGLGIDE